MSFLNCPVLASHILYFSLFPWVSCYSYSINISFVSVQLSVWHCKNQPKSHFKTSHTHCFYYPLNNETVAGNNSHKSYSFQYMVQTATDLLLVLLASEPKPRAWEPLEKEQSVMECGTHFLSCYCSQHPGAACCSPPGTQVSLTNPQDLFLMISLTFTQFFHCSKEKTRIKHLLFPNHHLKRLSWLYGSVFMQWFLI